MKFQFKIQRFQTEAVENVVNVFNGQLKKDAQTYLRDRGIQPETSPTLMDAENAEDAELDSIGFENAPIVLNKERLLANIVEIQRQNNIIESNELIASPGACSLDVEMETGTGKTYVYIKTIFELYKKYGNRSRRFFLSLERFAMILLERV